MIHYDPFKDVIFDRGAPVTKEYTTGKYLTGPCERWFDDPLTGMEVKRTVLSVIEHKPKGEKANNRTGPRKHHRPATLNHDGFWSLHGATEIVEKVEKKPRGKKSSKRKVTFDEDGCARISVADPRRKACKEMGIELDNIHTVDPDAFAKPSGARVPTAGYTRPKHPAGYKPLPKVKPTIADYTPDTWKCTDVKLYGHKNQHLKVAVCTVKKGKFTRTIDILRVRNVEEARIMLKSIHGIE